MNDDPIETLIRAAGKRAQAPDDAMQRVRAAVEEEWRASLRRRRTMRWTAVAAALIAAISIALLMPRSSKPLVIAEERAVDWSGNVLRVGADSRVVVVSPTVARLERGTVYVSRTQGPQVTIQTPFGDVRDIGTEFEVRLTDDRLEVRVDSGIVAFGNATANAGETLVATRAEVEKLIRLEGLRLEDVLQRVAREKGLTLDWRAPASAKTTTLRGTTPFSPDEALDAATAAGGVRWRVDGKRLVIE
jgi:ferric-dicitrate binding protein FerR (iron transport regulator)